MKKNIAKRRKNLLNKWGIYIVKMFLVMTYPIWIYTIFKWFGFRFGETSIWFDRFMLLLSASCLFFTFYVLVGIPAFSVEEEIEDELRKNSGGGSKSEIQSIFGDRER